RVVDPSTPKRPVKTHWASRLDCLRIQPQKAPRPSPSPRPPPTTTYESAPHLIVYILVHRFLRLVIEHPQWMLGRGDSAKSWPKLLSQASLMKGTIVLEIRYLAGPFLATDYVWRTNSVPLSLRAI